jgi:hypothetical protein
MKMAVAKKEKNNSARKTNTIFAPEECRPVLWRQRNRTK